MYGAVAAEMPVKFHNDTGIITSNLAAIAMLMSDIVILCSTMRTLAALTLCVLVAVAVGSPAMDRAVQLLDMLLKGRNRVNGSDDLNSIQ